jgi:carboxypeptidase C (cathepsin A)
MESTCSIRLLLTIVIVAAFSAFFGSAHAQDTRTSRAVALELPGRVLQFRVVTSLLPVRDDRGRIDARVGAIAFEAIGRNASRPVTFVIGGGPGTSSAFLNFGAAGPWRIGLEPAYPQGLTANADTWLDFTDLVFLDPPGVGLGHVQLSDMRARQRVWSVEGDIDLLADAMALWLRRGGRIGAPKILTGQSYGGFRAPRIAEALHQRHGLALSGMILMSPILDYGWRYNGRNAPLAYATLLPSLAAARMTRDGKLEVSKLQDVEAYARGPFIEDFLRGLRDPAALNRLIERVTEISGLPRDVVVRAQGRVDEKLFAREWRRAAGKVTSSYDPEVAATDPDPASLRPDFADPFLAAAKAPLTQAMTQILAMPAVVADRPAGEKLRSPRPYVVASEKVFEEWSWNTDHGLPESVTALGKMLALDPDLRVLVLHGYSDLQTPYFESRLILDQLPDFGPGRMVLKTFPGGHMFYTRAESRRMLRETVQTFAEKLRNRR